MYTGIFPDLCYNLYNMKHKEGEQPMEKPATVLIMGDSVAKGVIPQNGRYTHVEKSCVSHMTETLLTPIHSFTRFGATVSYGEKHLDSLVDKYQPDLVVLEYGGNDSDFDWASIAADPKGLHLPHTPMQEFQAAYTRILEKLKKLNIKTLLTNLPPIDAQRYFSWFSKGDLAFQKRVLLWLGEVGRIFWWHERYSDAIYRLARKWQVPLVDLRGEFMAEEDYRTLLSADGIHPNQKGQDVMFRCVQSFILEQGWA